MTGSIKNDSEIGYTTAYSNIHKDDIMCHYETLNPKQILTCGTLKVFRNNLQGGIRSRVLGQMKVIGCLNQRHQFSDISRLHNKIRSQRYMFHSTRTRNCLASMSFDACMRASLMSCFLINSNRFSSRRFENSTKGASTPSHLHRSIYTHVSML